MDRVFEEREHPTTWIFYAGLAVLMILGAVVGVCLEHSFVVMALVLCGGAVSPIRNAIQSYSAIGELLFIVRCRGDEVSWEVDGRPIVVSLRDTQQIALGGGGDSLRYLDFETSTTTISLTRVRFSHWDDLFLFLGEHFDGRMYKDGQIVRDRLDR